MAALQVVDIRDRFPRYKKSKQRPERAVELIVVPGNLICWEGDHLGLKPVKPQGYAPCELARLPQLARRLGREANGGST